MATLLHGSGFLAVYLAGLLLGNSPLPYKAGLLRVHDALAWLSQIGMFLILGLLVFPSRLPEVAGIGLAIALLLAVVLRPLTVALCLLPFRYPREGGRLRRLGRPPGRRPHRARHLPRARARAGRGPDLSPGVLPRGGERVHPGRHGGVGDAAAQAGGGGAARAAGVLAIESRQPLRGELHSFYIDDALVVAGLSLADLDFPESAAVALIVRGDQLIAPKGDTVLQVGDHVYLIAQEEDRPFVQLMFGRPEAE